MGNGTIFVGTYWSQRRESREEAAERIERFLDSLRANGSLFEQWFLKGRSRALSNTVLPLDVNAVAAALETNRRDVGGEDISELGFNLAVWNGDVASLDVTVGAFSPRVSNSAVLSIAAGESSLSSSDWKGILDLAVESFDPEHGMVTNQENLNNLNFINPWEAGRFIYERGHGVTEHP